MHDLQSLRKERALLNDISWDMTPEEAVRLYLEWGNNWAGGNYVIRGKNDYSLYFVINTWEATPVVFLVRRNSDAAEELAKLSLPTPLEEKFMASIGHNKGVYALDKDIKAWLQKELLGE